MLRYHLNAPLNNEGQILTDKITVMDPTHPLFGRIFTLASRVHCGSNILVTYRNDITLRIPFSATNLAGKQDLVVSKLTQASLYEFVSLAKEYKLLCHTNHINCGSECHNALNRKS